MPDAWIVLIAVFGWPVYLLREMLSYSRDHVFLGSSRRQILHVMELPVFLETCSLQFSKLMSSSKYRIMYRFSNKFSTKDFAHSCCWKANLHLVLKSQLSVAASWRHAGALVRWAPRGHKGFMSTHKFQGECCYVRG